MSLQRPTDRPRVQVNTAGRRVEVEQWLDSHGVEWEYRPGVSLEDIDIEKSLRNQARVFTVLDPDVVDNYAEATKRGETAPAAAVTPRDGDLIDPPAMVGNFSSWPRTRRLAAAARDGRWRASTAAAWQVSLWSQAAFLDRFTATTALAYGADLLDLNRYALSGDCAPLLLPRPALDTYIARHLVAERGLAVATVRRRCAALRGWYLWSVEEGLLLRSPAHRLPSLPRTATVPRLHLSSAETAALLEAAEHTTDPRAGLLVLLLLGHGLRVGEVLDADVPAARAGPLLEVTTKGGHRRRVVLARQAAAALSGACDGRVSGPLLLGTRGSRLARSSAVRLLRGVACEVLGEDRAAVLHPHACRRAFAVGVLDGGAGLRDLQHALGHRSPVQSLRYADSARHHDEVRLCLLPD